MKNPNRLLFLFLLYFFSTNLVNANIVYAVSSGAWDDANTWYMGNIPGATDSVRVDGYMIDIDDITGSVTVAYLELVNNTNPSSTNKSEITLTGNGTQGGIALTVLGDLIANVEDFDKGVEIYLTDGALLNVQGDVVFTKSADHSFGKKLYIEALDNSIVNFEGDFTYDYKTVNSSEASNEILIDNDAELNVAGITSLYQRGGNKFTFISYRNAKVNLDSTVIMEMSGGNEMKIDVKGNSFFTVNDEFRIENSGGAKAWINATASGNLTINGDLKMTSTANNKIVQLESTNNNCIIDIRGDLSLNAQTDADIFVILKANSNTYLGGNITRMGSNGFGDISMTTNARLTFNGIGNAQVLPDEKKPGSGTDAFSFSNIILENETGFTLEDTLLIEDNLELIKGNIVTDSANILILDENAYITGGNSDAFVDGPMIKLGAFSTAFVLPVGDKGIYAPITLSKATSSLTTVKGEFLADPPPWGNLAGGIDNVSDKQYWNLERNAASGNDLQVTLAWNNTSELGITNVDSLVVVSQSAPNYWDSYGIADALVIGEEGSITTADPPPWGNIIYTIGSVSPINVLPIELLKFQTIQQAEKIFLQWQTGSELNAHYFEVERSVDGRDFESIETILTKGKGVGIENYSTTDNAPYTGMNYYRLRMVDRDGSFKYSPIEVVKFETDPRIIVYPNPVANVLKLKAKDLKIGNATMEVYDRTGRLMYQDDIIFNGEDFHISTVDLNIVDLGTYYLKIVTPSKIRILKFIKADF